MAGWFERPTHDHSQILFVVLREQSLIHFWAEKQLKNVENPQRLLSSEYDEAVYDLQIIKNLQVELYFSG